MALWYVASHYMSTALSYLREPLDIFRSERYPPTMPRYCYFVAIVVLASAIGCGNVSLSTSDGATSNEAAATKVLCANILDDAKDNALETSSASIANANYNTTFVDQDDNGTIDQFTECEMVSVGVPKACVQKVFDTPGIVAHSLTTTYSYNADGTLRETHTDTGNGVPIITSYTYTAAGQVASVISGAYATSYTYSAAGYPERAQTGSDGDGMLDFVETFTYDTHGNLTQYQFDTLSSDAFDTSAMFQHSYDANGGILSTIATFDTEESVTWTYDSAGYIRAQGVDANGDGQDDIVGNYSVDADGRVQFTKPIDESTAPVSVSSITNPDGTIQATIHDVGADGTINARTISLNGQCSLE